MTVVILRPYEDGKTNQWTDFGGTGTAAWDHLNKTTAYEGGAGKPSTTVGIKTKTASRVASVKCRTNGTEAFVLPAGATIQKIVMYAYAKSGSATAAKAILFTAKGALSELGANSLSTTITATAFGWTRLEATSGSTGMAKAKEELEKGNVASIELKSGETAPAEHEAVEVFFEVEYEEAGGNRVSFTGKAAFAGSAAGKQTQFATGTGKASFGGSAQGTQAQATGVTGKATFAGSAAGAQAQFAKATGKATFRSSVRPRQTQPVSGTTNAQFAGSGATTQSQGLQASGQVLFAGSVSTAQRLFLTATGAVRFAGRATVKLAATTAKKALILIFDE